MQLDGEPWAQDIPVNSTQPLLVRPLALMQTHYYWVLSHMAGGMPQASSFAASSGNTLPSMCGRLLEFAVCRGDFQPRAGQAITRSA